MLSLLAVVDVGGFIGNKGQFPEFEDRREGAAVEKYAMDMTAGCHLIMGSTTASLMAKYGRSYEDPLEDRTVGVWSRGLGLTAMEFLTKAEATGKPVFVIGGQTMFRLFAPHCDNLIILRARMKRQSGFELIMPPLFPDWKTSTHSATANMQ